MVVSMTRLRALALIILSLLLAGVAAPASAEPHWPKEVKVLYVYDTAPRSWQVRQAAEYWDNGSGLDLRYTRKGCRAKYECIRVSQKVLPDGVAGVTPTWVWGDTNVRARSAVELNTGYRFHSRGFKRMTSCHELGHAIGLDHRASSGVFEPRHPQPTLTGSAAPDVEGHGSGAPAVRSRALIST